jgi:hypothetical protein
VCGELEFSGLNLINLRFHLMEELLMEDDNKNPPTDDDIVRTIMDVYRITEQEARRALREATTINSMTDF